MKLPQFKTSLRTQFQANTMLTAAVAALAVLAVLQQVKINEQHERIILVPPSVTEKLAVGWSDASAPYHEQWAMFLTLMVSQISPQTVDRTLTLIEQYFAPEIFRAIRTQLLSIKNDPQYFQSNMVNSIALRSAVYEPDTGKTFVTGILTTTAYADRTLSPIAAREVTYEMKLGLKAGLPVAKEFSSYLGPARTAEWAKQFPGLAAQAPNTGNRPNAFPQADANTAPAAASPGAEVPTTSTTPIAPTAAPAPPTAAPATNSIATQPGAKL